MNDLEARLVAALAQRGYHDPDGLIPKIVRAVRTEGKPANAVALARTLRRPKTKFFRANCVSPEETSHILWPVIVTGTEQETSPDRSLLRPVAQFVTVDEIESFDGVRAVLSGSVKDRLPLDILEDDIQKAIESILGEPEHQNDWGGETSDLFTTRLSLNGDRVPAAFLLKGRGLGTALTSARAGKRGTQIQRLYCEPADLFVVQHVGAIDPSVADEMRLRAASLAQQRGTTIYWCLIDGTDTARLLLAYGFLS